MNTAPNATAPVRSIEGQRKFSAKRFFLQWEWMLVAVLIIINIINICLSDNYLNYNGIMSALQMFMDKAVMIFPMMMVILLGDIDISVASTMALSGVVMGMAFQAGIPMPLAIVIALLIGTLCGFLNGLLLAKFKELSAVIVTLIGMIIYRGIASILLEDQAIGGFPAWFNKLAWDSIGPIPIALLFFIIEAAVFILLLHKTPFGRRVYAMGNNAETSRYSGIKVGRMKIIIFTLNGLFAAVAALFLVSKMGSVRPSIATGYELDVIAMVVLGGVSTAGGKGRAPGVILSMFIICLLQYGLGLINVPSQSIMIILGVLLIVAVAIPNLKTVLGETRLFKRLMTKKQLSKS